MEQAACGSLSEYFQHPVSILKQSYLVSAAEDIAQALHYLVCAHIIIIIFLFFLFLFFYPWVYSSQGLKAKVKIKAGVAIGPGRRQS